MFSAGGEKTTVKIQDGESNISIVVLKDIVEDLESMLKERFEYLNIPIAVRCITSKRLYQLAIMSNDVFTVMRSKKIVESILPNSRVIIESIGGIPYEENADLDYSAQSITGQA